MTKKSNVLIDELYFANGVALSPNEDYVLVAETAASQIRRYYLKGAKAGQNDVFIDSLPGIPDNLTPDNDGIWVPLGMSVDSEHPALWQSAANAPLVRKFLARILALAELPFKLIESIYPNLYTRSITHKIGHFEALAMKPVRQTILRIDWNGKIIGSLHGFDKSVENIAHVLEDGDYLYLGSFANRYLGRVKLPKTYKNRKATPKVEPTTTQKPVTKPTTTTTTTTPKPTTTKTTTTPKPATTTPKPTATTPKPATTAAPKPTPTKPTPTKPAPAKPTPAAATKKPNEPAPIHENIVDDTKRPNTEKLKIIKKSGDRGEL